MLNTGEQVTTACNVVPVLKIIFLRLRMSFKHIPLVYRLCYYTITKEKPINYPSANNRGTVYQQYSQQQVRAIARINFRLFGYTFIVTQ